MYCAGLRCVLRKFIKKKEIRNDISNDKNLKEIKLKQKRPTTEHFSFFFIFFFWKRLSTNNRTLPVLYTNVRKLSETRRHWIVSVLFGHTDLPRPRFLATKERKNKYYIFLLLTPPFDGQTSPVNVEFCCARCNKTIQLNGIGADNNIVRNCFNRMVNNGMVSSSLPAM